MDRFDLPAGVQVLWYGRPAPRCYTFRRWKQALAGAALFVLSSFWLLLAWQLVADGHSRWLLLVPLPLIVGSFLFGPAQILRARLQWPHVYFILTDEYLMSSNGRALPLAEIGSVEVRRQGKQLASLRISTATGEALVISCIEYPDRLLELLRSRCPRISI